MIWADPAAADAAAWAAAARAVAAGGGPGGGGGMRMGGGGGGRGGMGGMGGDLTEHRFNLTLSVMFNNLINHYNPGGFIGNLNSPQFGQATSINSGFGGGPGEAVSAAASPTTGASSSKRALPSNRLPKKRGNRLPLTRAASRLMLQCLQELTQPRP